MRNLLKGLALSLSFLSGCGWFNIKESIEDRVENIIDDVMLEHRNKFGLPYFDRPEISYDMPEGFALYGGAYDDALNIVFINKNKCYVFDNEVDSELTLRMKESGFTIERVLEHELGHYYTGRLAESVGTTDLFLFEVSEDYRRKIILEGIAEYFGKTGEYKDGFDYLRTNNLFELSHVVYEAGHDLVKPIIDEYGVLGIKYMICNLPSVEQLTNLCDYQEQAFRELEMIRNKEIEFECRRNY